MNIRLRLDRCRFDLLPQILDQMEMAASTLIVRQPGVGSRFFLPCVHVHADERSVFAKSRHMQCWISVCSHITAGINADCNACSPEWSHSICIFNDPNPANAELQKLANDLSIQRHALRGAYPHEGKEV